MTEDRSTAEPFEDHFSAQAKAYARYRPRYPAGLFAAVAAFASSKERAWDVGCGSGQAALALAEHFAEVVATDASADQVEHAQPHERIRYRVAPAEASGLGAGSVDLVFAAAAAHWFDHERFYAEVRRVLRPGGAIALVSYGVEIDVDPAVNAVFHRWHDEVLGGDWPERFALVKAKYATLPFPFPHEELVPPASGRWACEADWTLEEAVGMFRTWSASQRYAERTGTDPAPAFAEELRAAWPDDDEPVRIRLPLFYRAGRVAGPDDDEPG